MQDLHNRKTSPIEPARCVFALGCSRYGRGTRGTSQWVPSAPVKGSNAHVPAHMGWPAASDAIDCPAKKTQKISAYEESNSRRAARTNENNQLTTTPPEGQ